jgi:hypothetical protein
MWWGLIFRITWVTGLGVAVLIVCLVMLDVIMINVLGLSPSDGNVLSGLAALLLLLIISSMMAAREKQAERAADIDETGAKIKRRRHRRSVS